MTTIAKLKEKVWIPEVSKKEIRERFKKIKPVVRFAKGIRLFKSSEGYPYFIKQVDLFRIAYTWDPKPKKVAKNLKSLCDITTYHSWAYYGCFKPSIAEVLAQIPDEHLDKVVAFEIVANPETAADLCQEKEALNAGYHVATTRLYVEE